MAWVFREPTIGGLAKLVEEGGAGLERWTSLVPMQPCGSRPPLYCVHGGAGTILHLWALAKRLGIDQPFYGLQARGLYGGDPPLMCVEEMAEHYLAEVRSVQASGPYFLVGYCFGSIVAFEMAQRLRQSGEEVGLLAAVNGPSSVWIRRYGGLGGQASRRAARAVLPPPRPNSRRVVGVLTSPSKLRRWASHMVWKSRQTVFDPLHGRLALTLGRPLRGSVRERFFLHLHITAERAYVPERYPGRIVTFYGDGLYDDPDLGWRDLVDDVTAFAVPGQHRRNRDALAEPHVAFIAEHLNELVSRYEQQSSLADALRARTETRRVARFDCDALTPHEGIAADARTAASATARGNLVHRE